MGQGHSPLSKRKQGCTGCEDSHTCLSESGRRLFFQALKGSSSGDLERDLLTDETQSSTSSLPPIESFRNDPQNALCADCSDVSSSWASVTHGVFLCKLCVGAHRALGSDVSFTQSTLLDENYWTSEKIDQFKDKGGNLQVNAEMEYHVPVDILKPSPGIPGKKRREYIRMKYKDKAFTKLVSGQSDSREPVYWRDTKKLEHSGSLVCGRRNYVGIVNITVFRAVNLSSSNNIHKAITATTSSQVINPYLKLTLGTHEVWTTAKKHTCDPVWNESAENDLKFSIPWNGSDRLAIQACSHEHLMKDVILGQASPDLSSLTRLYQADDQDILAETWVDIYKFKIKRPCSCSSGEREVKGSLVELAPRDSDDSDELDVSSRRRRDSFKKIPRYVKHSLKNARADTMKRAIPRLNGEDKTACNRCKNVQLTCAGKVHLGFSFLDLDST